MTKRSKTPAPNKPGGDSATAEPVQTVAADASVESTPSPPETEEEPLVVGIGASAGGLEAYKAFFDKMPTGSNIAFVLVQHLSPDHSSMLVDLISRHTAMQVQEATDGTSVQAGHVYVIPPDATLTIAEGVLQLTKPAPPRSTAGRSTASSSRLPRTRATTRSRSCCRAAAATARAACAR
jgi:chemotaxis response regulator CheB